MKPTQRGRLIAALSLLLGGAAPRAWAGPGTTAAEFLKVENGARPAAMGGAYAAAARDLAGGLYWNPAGLGFLDGHAVEAAYDSSIQGVNQGYLAYGRSLRGLGGLALGLSYLDAGRQQQTQASPDGGYAVLGSFTPSAWAVSAGWGRSFLAGRAAAGVVVKELDETLYTGGGQAGNPDDSASAIAWDAGVLARFLDRRLSLGAAYQNLGPKMAGYDLPAVLRAGAAWESGRFAGTLDFLAPRGERLEARAGAELAVFKPLALRLGYSSGLGGAGGGGSRALNSGFSMGMGLRLSGLGFDYAFVPYGDLGYSHRLALSYRWGSRAEVAAAAARVETERREQAADAVCPDEARRAARLSDEEADVEARFKRVDELIAAGDFLASLRALDYWRLGLGADDPRQVRYLERWGTVLYRTGNFSAAEFSYKDALRTAARLGVRGPAVAAAYAGLARCRRGAGDAPGARAAYQRALGSCPSEELRSALEGELRTLEGQGP